MIARRGLSLVRISAAASVSPRGLSPSSYRHLSLIATGSNLSSSSSLVSRRQATCSGPKVICDLYQRSSSSSSSPPGNGRGGGITTLKAVWTKLTSSLVGVDECSVTNESWMHNVPAGSETHLKLLVVCSQFEGQPLVKRHRLVYNTIHEEITSRGIHAVAIQTVSSTEWEDLSEEERQAAREGRSPPCRGGDKKKSPPRPPPPPAGTVQTA